MKHTYNVIGMMSGTSLDGLDMAHCTFRFENYKWSFVINHAETISYEKEMIVYLSNLNNVSGVDLIAADRNYGKWMGSQVKAFVSKHLLQTDFIASHGHTIFHQPDKGFTFQLGHGPAIAAECGLPVISDFRSLDVALGGQGAPLVPIGDKYLFAEFGACLNLGGFANISFEADGNRLAFDICPCNVLLNEYAEKLGKPFDDGGQLASRGKVSTVLLTQLNELAFYLKRGPKSLGMEWVNMEVKPILNAINLSTQDMLCTLVEHIAIQIANSSDGKGNILVTGGGAFNTYLCSRIQAVSSKLLSIPDTKLIAFKEAVVFAFLGVLHTRHEANSLSSVTGARNNSVGGNYCH